MDKKRKTRILLFALLTLLIMAFIFCMSAQDADRSKQTSLGFLGSIVGKAIEPILPSLTDKGIENDIRKYAHMFEFACLGLSSCLLFCECFRDRSHGLCKSGASALVFCSLYACSDEIHQFFVPGRAGRFSDVLVDMVGVVTAVLIVMSVNGLQHYRNYKRSI